MPSLLAYKLRAALPSLAVYLVFAAVLWGFVAQVWFPGHLFWLDGGLQGLQLVLAVDLVLGPVLAFVVMSPGKTRRKLLQDIAVLALLQAGSMAWGLWQVREQRPVAVVYGSGRFISVAPRIMALQHETAASLARFSPHSPPLVYRRPARDGEERERLLGMLMRGGFHPEAQAWLFQPFAPNREQVFRRHEEVSAFVRQHLAEEWRQWAQAHAGVAAEDWRLAFFEGRFGNAVLVFSPAGEPAGYLDLAGRPIPPEPLALPPGGLSRGSASTGRSP